MKILIVGSVASGKSTFARKLSQVLDIKCYEIDLVVHDDKNNYKRSDIEQKKIFNTINKEKNWIIEGTLRHNQDYLIDMADRIIFIDTANYIRKWRIFTRYIKQSLKLEKCNYEVNLKMIRLMYMWNRDFEEKRDKFLDRINKYPRKVIIVKDSHL